MGGEEGSEEKEGEDRKDERGREETLFGYNSCTISSEAVNR